MSLDRLHLLIRPLIDSGLIDPDEALTATSITDYSGGGRKLIDQYEVEPVPAALTSPRPDGLTLSHKHLPEMTRHSGLRTFPIFMPVVSTSIRA